MEYRDLQALAERLGVLVGRELKQRLDVAYCEEQIKTRKLLAANAAIKAGELTGKNAATREAQLAAILADDKRIVAQRADLEDAREILCVTSGNHAALEAEIKLTTAWLYSQARIV